MQKQTQRRKHTIALSALLIIVVGLALYFLFQTSTTSTEPWTMEHKNFQLHEYEGENLVSLDESPPFDKSNKVLYNGKTYGLKLSFDKPYISPIPSSEITGHIEIFEDGKKLNKLPEEFAMSPMRTLAHNYEDESVFAVSLNSWTLMNAVGSVRVDDNNLKYGVYENDFIETTKWETWQEIWYNYIGWPRPDFGVNRYHINSSFAHIYSPDLFEKAPRGLALAPDIWLDISDGDAEFTFVYDGTRAQPFLNFEVAMKYTSTGFKGGTETLKDERGYLSITRSLFFEDQFKNPVDISGIDRISKTSFYYDVHATPSQLTPNQPQTITLDITSKNKNGSLNDSPYQRVLVRADLASSIFKTNEIVEARRGECLYSDFLGCNVPRMNSSSNLLLAFLGTTLRTNYGQFDGYKNESQFIDENEDTNTNPIGNVFNFDEAVLEFGEIFGELEDSGKNPDVIDSIDKLKAQLQLYPASEEKALEIIKEWKEKTKKYIEDAGVDVPDYFNLEPDRLFELIRDGKTSLIESDLYSEFDKTSTSSLLTTDFDKPLFVSSNLITVPLVDGKASVTYTYSGLIGHQPMITFRVSPVDAYTGLKGCSLSPNANTKICADNIQVALENLPTQPIEEEPSGSLLSTLNDYILYGEWLEPTSLELGAHTTISIPIGDQATSQLINQASKFIPQLVLNTTNKIPNHLLWLMTLQLAQILFGGLWLIFKYNEKPKTK